MPSKIFDKNTIKKIAKEYIFNKNITYKKLAEKYGCSKTKIVNIFNTELKEISIILYFLVKHKAKKSKIINKK